MGKQIDLREATKTKWHSTTEAGTNGSYYPGDENIKLGCLMRIADASEAMAKNHVRLQDDYDYMRKDRDKYRGLYESFKNSNRALRGQITKLKKRIVK